MGRVERSRVEHAVPTLSRSQVRHSVVWGGTVAFLVTAVLCLPVDLAVARFCRDGHYPKVVEDLLNNAEPFGHAAGVAFIVVTVWVLDERSGRRWAPWLAVTAVAGGMAANLLKLLVGRTRPRHYASLPDSWQETFRGWLPWLSEGTGGQSFPSAHTATAVALAVMLSAAYPRGRWWFATLAILVGLHRVQSGAHYPSDVFAGAAVGWLVGQGCLLFLRRYETVAADVPSGTTHDAACRAA